MNEEQKAQLEQLSPSDKAEFAAKMAHEALKTAFRMAILGAVLAFAGAVSVIASIFLRMA